MFEKHNGVLGAAGTAAWAFERKGTITLPKDATEDQLMEVAVGAGAEDYQDAIGNSPFAYDITLDHVQKTTDLMAKYGVGKMAAPPKARRIARVSTLSFSPVDVPWYAT